MTGFHVPRYTIQTLLRDINPEGTEFRRRHRLRRRVYSNPGPNYVWHIDGRDKLKPFGFSVHGAIDGYSRKVLWVSSPFKQFTQCYRGYLFGLCERNGGVPN